MRISIVAVMFMAAGACGARGQSLTTLGTFDGVNGSGPNGSLIIDANGNLLGTASGGGASGYGTVFELQNTGSGYAATPAVVVDLTLADGRYPSAGLTVDASGNLYGTGVVGGTAQGTAFEIQKTGSSYASAATVLANFGVGSAGAQPRGGLLIDAGGNLLGTTYYGGTSGDGTVFEIQKAGSGYAAAPTTLFNFSGTNGIAPQAGLVADANGNLFGTTYFGGSSIPANGGYGYGSVFEIPKTGAGYASTPTTLTSFNGTNGSEPTANLIVDANGDLFGTTRFGGPAGDGTVFEIQNTGSGYLSAPTTLAYFDGTDGSDLGGPSGGGNLIMDANGDLFGTASSGGTFGDGTVFEVQKTLAGYSNTPITLFNFDGIDGSVPLDGLVADADGDLLGTTSSGGLNGDGTVFEITASGYQSGGASNVPEPGSVGVFVTGIIGMLMRRSRKRG
jgi:uncharacterized repeat protein (TIGR03803 family)